MGSVAAKAVADEVIRTVRKGKKPNISKIAVKHGYSPASAKASKPQKTKAYQEVMIPFVEKLAERREKALNAITDKKLKSTSARNLASIVDVLTKNHQLLTGGATSNVAIGVRRLNDADLERIAESDADDNATAGAAGTSEEGTREA